MSLPAHYAPHKWTLLESYMLSQAILTHAQAGNVKDRQWIKIALSFLKTFTVNFGRSSVVSQSDEASHVSNVLDPLKAVADNLDEGKSNGFSCII
jgi:trafficking protein particle complex subunit 10